MKKYLFNSCWF